MVESKEQVNQASQSAMSCELSEYDVDVENVNNNVDPTAATRENEGNDEIFNSNQKRSKRFHNVFDAVGK